MTEFSFEEQNGVIHRTNGPAWINPGCGHTPLGYYWHWRLFGVRHRYYGPQNRDDDWWLHGKRVK
jgi:hypothetical protein